jgi:hypothetical protein
MAIKLTRTILVGLSVVPVVALLAWLFFPDFAETHSRQADSAVTFNVAVLDADDDPIERETVPAAPQTAMAPAVADPPPVVADPLGRLSISRQSFRRGGLGSRALMAFTIRNRNDYAVKDLQLLCTFRSRDGSYSTERLRTISETVETKSRKRFPLTHIGFVNVKASKAKCALVTAERA